MIDAEVLRRRLAERLAERGDLRSEAWRRAVERVPRYLLVPRFYRQEDDGFRLVDGSDPGQREEWLRAVYDPQESLVTEHDPATGAPTSSATMPSIVLVLLEALDVQPDHRVLEVGTGSGYSAALLCERVGSANVTTIDIGAEVVEQARRRLAEIGHRPHLVCGDGFEGYAAHAPYDRVLAMVGLDRVPRAWVEQTRPGGVILATLPSMTARLERRQDGSAQGRFVGGFGFMAMRGHAPLHLPESRARALVQGEGEERAPSVDVLPMLRGERIPGFWGLARLLLMPFDTTVAIDRQRTAIVEATDRSWVLIDLERNRVRQGGPRRLWDALEDLYLLLEHHGRPSRDRFGLTVRPDGRQLVWLDDPDAGPRWELPVRAAGRG